MKIKGITLAALAAILITVVGLWLTNRAVTPREAAWEDAVAEGKAGGYRIITTDEFAELYRKDRGGLLLVDTRQAWEYQAGHLEGAENFPMEPTAWAEWRKAATLEKFLGPDKDRTLVFY